MSKSEQDKRILQEFQWKWSSFSLPHPGKSWGGIRERDHLSHSNPKINTLGIKQPGESYHN